MRVLYIGAGNPISPRSGMDVVARAHLHELTADPQFELYGTMVASSSAPSPSGSKIPPPGIVTFVGDSQAQRSSLMRTLDKLLFLGSGGLISQYAFRSCRARQKIRQQFSEPHDCVVIDHFIAITNVPMLFLFKEVWRGREKLIFISHDVTPKGMIDNAKLGRSFATKFVYWVQAAQALMIELALCNLSKLVIFISSYDRQCYGGWAGRCTVSLCPMLSEVVPPTSDTEALCSSPYFLFIGAPNFPPNAFAISWLASRLSPLLLQMNPEISILLIGNGTDRLPADTLENVKGLGFVSDARLQQMLAGAVGLVSPVVHGSGIKIKVLEALAAGCPVLATEESLRGFEFMEIPPMLFTNDPSRSAEVLINLVQDKGAQKALRDKVGRKWSQFAKSRIGSMGRLLALVGSQV